MPNDTTHAVPLAAPAFRCCVCRAATGADVILLFGCVAHIAVHGACYDAAQRDHERRRARRAAARLLRGGLS